MVNGERRSPPTVTKKKKHGEKGKIYLAATKQATMSWKKFECLTPWWRSGCTFASQSKHLQFNSRFLHVIKTTLLSKKFLKQQITIRKSTTISLPILTR